jgi:hypothetical protein
MRDAQPLHRPTPLEEWGEVEAILTLRCIDKITSHGGDNWYGDPPSKIRSIGRMYDYTNHGMGSMMKALT